MSCNLVLNKGLAVCLNYSVDHEISCWFKTEQVLVSNQSEIWTYIATMQNSTIINCQINKF